MSPETPGSYEQDTGKQLAPEQPEACTSSNHHRPPKEEERAPLPPQDASEDGKKLLEECWQDYIRIFGKTEAFVYNKSNRDHLRELLPHLVKRAKPGMARVLFQCAMEQLAKDDWITGKKGNSKHDFPAIVFKLPRVLEYLDKAQGVTVD